MREHKYQAWHKRQRELFEVSAIQFRDPSYVTKPAFVVKKSLSGLNIETYTLDEVKLRESTGIIDKNGKEIYEGDIVQYLDNTSQGLVKKIVTITDIRHLPAFDCSKWEEIIGNIYENPKLLEVKMMSTERDTHFQSFAKLLLREMFGDASDITVYTWDEEGIARLELIIAQRIYDLFIHDRLNTGTSDLQHAASYVEAEELVNGIPDITTRFGQEGK